jgi:dienelactone hydrolase
MKGLLLLGASLIISACTATNEPPSQTAVAAALVAAAPQAAPAGPTRDAQGNIVPPPGQDMSKLTSAAPEPPGPGTQLGPQTPVTIVAAEGLPTHTVYYPSYIAGLSGAAKLPVLIWGNGACRNEGRRFEGTLTKVASHGFLVVAVGLYEPKEGAPSTTGKQMVEGIDWSVKANTSVAALKGKIDTDKVAVMGQSCGGLMTIEAAHDPRIDTIGIINSGVYNAGPNTGRSITTATKETLKTVHSPALYINGGEEDAAWPNSNDDVARLNQVPVFYGVMKGAGHIATHRHKNGGRFAEVITAWLEYQLKGDQQAARMFVGPQCGLCTDPQWVVTKKNMS